MGDAYGDPIPPGHGETTRVGATPAPTMPCPVCGGRGQLPAGINVRVPCDVCDGAGTIPQSWLNEWQRGYLVGLTAYAWWKDGVQYVGTSGTTLSDAARRFLADNQPARQRPLEPMGNRGTDEWIGRDS